MPEFKEQRGGKDQQILTLKKIGWSMNNTLYNAAFLNNEFLLMSSITKAASIHFRRGLKTKWQLYSCCFFFQSGSNFREASTKGPDNTCVETASLFKYVVARQWPAAGRTT